MAKYSKYIDYEFASSIEPENIPMVNFPNGFYPGTMSGYLKDIVKGSDGRFQYVVELRYRNADYESETVTTRFSYSAFKKYFADVTVLP